MEQKRNQIFIPTVAEFAGDIQTSLDIQKPLFDAGFKPGLMVVVRKGIFGVTNPDVVKKQYDNLSKIANQYGDSDVVVMLANLPLKDIDTLHNSGLAFDHIKAGIDFARALPIGNKRTLTFHLNSLVSESEFKSKTRTQWYEEFDKTIVPVLDRVSKAAGGVEVLIETVPTPEFGDDAKDNKETYNGTQRRELRNPFYVFGNNLIGSRIKQAGLGICTDLCHNRTIYRQALSGNKQGVLFPEDAEHIKIINNVGDRLVIDVLSSQLVHLNDGRGDYNHEGEHFEEGVALGQGDIPNLKQINAIIASTKKPFVFEINETDFANRPNTKASIDYVLKN